MIVDVEDLPGLRADGLLAQRAFSRLVADPLAFTQDLYERLFALAPTLRELFPRELGSQHAKFAQSLVNMLGFLASPIELGVSLRQLGARHRGYGAQPQHLVMLGEALVQTLDAQGQGLSRAERSAWQRVFAWIMASMLLGWGERP